MTEAAATAQAGVGHPGDEIGLRNRLRARWQGLPETHRAAISIGAIIVASLLLFFIDHALAFGLLTIGAVYWIFRLPPLPYRLAAQGALVLDFLAASGRSAPDLPVYAASADSGLPDDPFLQDILRSDQTPFWRLGVPALMITDTANLRQGNVYHSAEDDLSHIDYAFAARVVRAALSAICIRAGLSPAG